MGPCFDCSGLTQGAFRDAGTWIPRDAYQQRAFATPVTDVRDAMPGDLLFFGDSDAVEDVGAFYTLVPIRPRSRGERRSLRTSSRRVSPPIPRFFAFDPDTPFSARL